ncbi:S8 family serine peptidase [Cellulomonas hominis]|uniref:S8 family serine peptidase n=1 Tax=Cellulomonas hominis TaxID=156981 RepID=UPI001B990B6E|nr:S8 family serine peptidase [Cellulomonas hominis]VTR77011.1 Thermophilic serine proteinase [Cellulomonas hominis]
MRQIVRTVTVLAVTASLALGAWPAAQADPGPVPDPTTGEVPDRSSLTPAPAATSGDVPEASTEHVLVRFAPEVSQRQRAATLSAEGLAADEAVGGTGFVEVPVGDADPAELVAALDADPRVAEVQLDHVRTAAGWTDDPLVGLAWPYLDLLRLPRAWDVTTGSGQVIAVLDTGVDPSHEDLAGRLVPGWDAVHEDADASDDQWHGTAVAGTAAAAGDNGVGSVGAGYDAKIMPVKVLSASGSGYDSDVAQGITWAADHDADIINLSLGGPDASPVLRAAIQDAIAKGSVVVASAGNEGTEVPNYPAAYAPGLAGLLSVGATDDGGAVTDFSSWGDTVTVAAPGYEIVVPFNGGGYLYASGTSFSAPLVSGVAALLTARGVEPAQVESSLVSTARDAGPRGSDPYYGAGIVDAAAALGLGVSIPLDRAPGDGGSDDTAGRATPLALATTTTAALSPEGDQDWYALTATEPGWYSVVVDPSASDVPATRPRVTALADDGQVLAEGQAVEAGQTLTLPVPVPAAGTFRVGVANVDGAWGDDYTVDVRRTGSAFFSRTTSANLGHATQMQAPADLNGDGRVDVVRAVQGSATSVTLDTGDGTGSFPLSTAVPLGGLTGSITGLAVADVDGNGQEDVLVASSAGLVVVRQTAGVLTADPAVPVAGGVSALEVSDLDGDHAADLVTTEGSPAATVTRHNAGTGTFEAPVAVGASFPALHVGDLTGDGRGDLVSGAGEVRIQQPDGSFVAAGQVPASSGTADLALGDVTGDGRIDVVRSVTGTPGTIQVAPGRGDGTFATSVPSATAPNPEALVVADVTGDGRQDVVTVAGGWNAVSVLAQRPDGTLSTSGSTWVSYASHYFGDPLAVRDVTGDGTADVVLASTVLETLVQQPLAGTGSGAWVLDASVAPHQAGVDGRPTLTVTVGRSLASGAVQASTVRVVDAVSGTDVAATRAYDAGTGAVSVTPAADLVPGRHYQLWVGGLTDADGAVQAEPYRVPFTAGADGERFTPVTPWRVLDTRNGTGAGGPVRPGAPITLDVGGDLVPEDASAVVLNVTAVGPTGTGNVRVYPTPSAGGAPPTVSNLNVVPGTDQPNLVTVSLGSGGRVTLATEGTTAHLLADVAGYYRTGGATGFVPLDPVRVMDTRSGTGGVPKAQVAAGRWVDLVVRGRQGVPADASAVVLNVTGVSPTGKTNVRVYPTPAASEDQAPPTVSNLNLSGGRDQPNLVTVTVGDGGRVRFYTQTAAVHLVADLAGYYSPTGDRGYVPLDPTRIADSRSGLGLTGGPLQAGVPATLTVAGAGGVPADADAAVLNVTAVRPDRLSNLRVYPANAAGTVPLVSNLNVVAGRDEPNLVIARLGQGGAVSLYSQTARIGVVVDVAGYFRR